MGKRGARRLSPRAVVVAVTGLAALSILFVVAWKSLTSKADHPTVAILDGGDFQDDSFEGQGQWYGLCSKDSIHSIEDFRRTVASDPALMIHFADFKWERAVVERLAKPVSAYVYFRKNNAIFRKAEPIRLPTGDEYITDGRTRIRTHCCNDYVEAPPVLTTTSEQTEEEREEPLPGAPRMFPVPGVPVPPTPSMSLVPHPSTVWPGAAWFPWARIRDNDGGETPPVPPPVNPPASVPEPTAGILLCIGITALALVFVIARSGFRKREP